MQYCFDYGFRGSSISKRQRDIIYVDVLRNSRLLFDTLAIANIERRSAYSSVPFTGPVY